MEGRTLWTLDLVAAAAERRRGRTLRQALGALEPGDFATLVSEPGEFLAVAVGEVHTEGPGARTGAPRVTRGATPPTSSHRAVRETLFLEGFGFVDLQVTARLPVRPQGAQLQLGAAVECSGEAVLELAGGRASRLDFESRLQILDRQRLRCPAGAFETVKLRESVCFRGTAAASPLVLSLAVTTWKAPRVGVLHQEASASGERAGFELTARDPLFVPESSRVLMLAYALGGIRLARGRSGRRDLS